METQMIGSKIARARKERNMSQAQLAQLLFISPQAAGKWERGESIPDINKQEVELLSKQFIIIPKVIAKQRIRFYK